jgi:hypothetical protein
MRLIIIPEDGFVSIDGEGFMGLDLSFLDESIHAIQWYGTDGEVERKNPRGRIISNEIITSVTPYQLAIDKWNIAKVEQENAVNMESNAPELVDGVQE